MKIAGITALVLLAAFVSVAATVPETQETLLEQSRARDAEANPVLRGDLTVFFPDQPPFALFAGVDDAALPTAAFLIDPGTDTNIPAFGGAEVWGSAYDPDNDKIYFNDGSVLYEWPVGAGTATMLGTVMDPTGAPLSMVGLAFYNGALYGTRNVSNEAIYLIDTTTYIATVHIDFDDVLLDCGGFAADPNTGDFYCTSDDSDTRGLNLINPDGTATLITPYPDSQTDIDGLAVSDDGYAYLVIDEPGSIYVWDFVAGVFDPPLTSPFTTSEVFSGGAWLFDADGPGITLEKTVGDVPAVCAVTDQISVPYGTDVYYCYHATNTGTVPLEIHDLEDDQLGTILSSFPATLNPGDDIEVLVTTNITAAVVNSATWTAYEGAVGYTYDDTVNYSFVDISMTGTPTNLTDDGEFGVTMPFDFTFYGMTSPDVCLGNNGGMVFGSTSCSVSYGNAALPASGIEMGILPFWDDLSAEWGNVYYETVGVAPNQQFIVQWDERPHYSGIGDATFQVILFEGTNEILFQYLDTNFGDPVYDFGASATIGLNEDATSAVEYSYNTASLTDQLAILWTPSGGGVSDTDTAEVLLLSPDIDVTPLSLMASQMTNVITSQQLTIANVGDSPLDWTIDEDNPADAAYFPPMGPAGHGDNSMAAEYTYTEHPKEEVPWSADAPVWVSPDVVLFDSGPLVTCPGCGSGGADESAVETAAGMSTYGFGHQVSAGNRIADDFDVAAGGWFVETITFFAYQSFSSTTSTITGVNLQIWDGSPDNPASTVVWGDDITNVMTATGWTNIYRVLDTDTGNSDRPIMANVVTVNAFLPAGTYWLDWQSDGSLASGPWAPPITILGTANTGDALQWIPANAAWTPAIDTGSGAQQGFPFVVEGSTDQPPCAVPDDIPWLSLSTTAGSTLPAASDLVDVTFDSTGIPLGTLNAHLCVLSNDPDEPVVPVPVTLEVIIPVELQRFTIE